MDPPTWSSLENRPALYAAVQLAFAEGAKWADRALEPLKMPNQTRPTFDWAWIRDVAEQVARGRSVGIGAVHGSAKVVVVEGQWWALLGQGVVLCSASAAERETVARRVLRVTFESALDG